MKKIPKHVALSATNPPTAPPTIGPVFEFEEALEMLPVDGSTVGTYTMYCVYVTPMPEGTGATFPLSVAVLYDCPGDLRLCTPKLPKTVATNEFSAHPCCHCHAISTACCTSDRDSDIKLGESRMG